MRVALKSIFSAKEPTHCCFKILDTCLMMSPFTIDFTTLSFVVRNRSLDHKPLDLAMFSTWSRFSYSSSGVSFPVSNSFPSFPSFSTFLPMSRGLASLPLSDKLWALSSLLCLRIGHGGRTPKNYWPSRKTTPFSLMLSTSRHR